MNMIRFICVCLLASILHLSSSQVIGESFVIESERSIPIIDTVDIVVAGGSSGAVAAAQEAAKQGMSVFLITPHTYLGHDMCATYRLNPQPGLNPSTELAERIYAVEENQLQTEYLAPRPMHVKRVLEKTLLDNNVKFLFSSYPTDVLIDENGETCGIVISNRSGRQAIIAKKVIDATERGTIARIAGLPFTEYPKGKQVFHWVVMGGEPVEDNAVINARKLPAPFWSLLHEPVVERESFSYDAGMPKNWDKTYIEYTLQINMPNDSAAAFAEALQTIRDITWNSEQFESSQILWQIPPDKLISSKSADGWKNNNSINIDAFKAASDDNIYVLGGCADISREAAEDMLLPVNYMQAGKLLAQAIIKEMSELKSEKLADYEVVKKVFVKSEKPSNTPAAQGDVKELLKGPRPTWQAVSFVKSGERKLPVIGQYDVVVVGGGTGGAPAAISAARSGAKTLVVEYQSDLGGMGTVGLIGTYYFGNRIGFTTEIDNGLIEMSKKAGDSGLSDGDTRNIEYRRQWFRRELRKAGGDIWFNSIGCGAFVENGTVKGVIVATDQGRGVVLCKNVIDSTGSSDIAIAAGADYMFTSAESAAIQGTGLSFRDLRVQYQNTDYMFVDDVDMMDVWRAFIGAREKFKDHYDLATMIGSRERRRIVGDYTLTPLDLINNRTFEDSIVISRSRFDLHGFTTHHVFMLKPPLVEEPMFAYMPYRCMLPKGIDGVIVTGLGVSAHRDVMAVIRMQPDIQNQGYAAGIAAATASKQNKTFRQIDIKELQKKLVDKGCLPASVLTDVDSFPLSESEIRQAIKNAADDYEGVAAILTAPEQAIPLLKQAYNDAQSEQTKVIYAHILAVMGENTGLDTLIKAVEKTPWDTGWNFLSYGQYGASMSPLDSKIIALGFLKDAKALPVIIEKINQLGNKSEFSHYRAVAMAAEMIGDDSAAKPLAELLSLPEMTGYYITEQTVVSQEMKFTTSRAFSLREIILARALYRCGDYNNLGKTILENYLQDLRGHYSRHAHAILDLN